MLYLHQDLVKSKEESSSSDGDGEGKGGGHNVGEQRGGSYAARIQIGIEKDGSPQYRYFKTAEEHRKYLEKKGESKSGKTKRGEGATPEKLKEKLKKEQSESSRKIKDRKKRTSLFLKDKNTRSSKKDADSKVKKSFDLFIWSI